MINQQDDLTTAVPPLHSIPARPKSSDFKRFRRYLRTAQQREALDQFIKAGWTPAELTEYARIMYPVTREQKPTAVAYRFLIEKGPYHRWAKDALASMRPAGLVEPTVDKAEPKEYERDDPDNPAHSAEVKSACYNLARGCMNSYDDKLRRPRRSPDTPIRKSLLRKCFRELYDADAFGLRTSGRS